MLNKIKMYIPGLKYRPSMGQGICWFSCLGIFKHLLKFKYHYRRLFVTSLDFSFWPQIFNYLSHAPYLLARRKRKQHHFWLCQSAVINSSGFPPLKKKWGNKQQAILHLNWLKVHHSTSLFQSFQNVHTIKCSKWFVNCHLIKIIQCKENSCWVLLLNSHKGPSVFSQEQWASEQALLSSQPGRHCPLSSTKAPTDCSSNKKRKRSSVNSSHKSQDLPICKMNTDHAHFPERKLNPKYPY